MINQPARIDAIYRYPVKGLSPQKLEQTSLSPGQTLPADRIYAIENGPSGFNPAAPKYLPKQRFLMLMKNARLASLKAFYDDSGHNLAIYFDGHQDAHGDLRTAEGRAHIGSFFASFCADELNGPPKVLHAKGHSFSDVANKVVSIINLESVAAVAKAAGAPVDPLRFRGNIYVAGWPAWREFELMGKTLTINGARLKVIKRIVRCAATDVDPATGIRDRTIPKTLQQSFRHAECGVYAEVLAGGDIATGGAITVGA